MAKSKKGLIRKLETRLARKKAKEAKKKERLADIKKVESLRKQLRG
jgi:hypothetical protein